MFHPEIFNIGNLYLSIELIVAELIFLFSCPRRKWFILRFLGAVGLCLALSYFFPMPSLVRWNPYYLFFRMVVLFVYSIGAMAVCFNLKFVPLVSSCVSGYAVQHIAYQVTAMITNLTKVLANSGYRSSLAELCFFPGVYLVMFLTFGLFAAKYKSHQSSDWRLLILSGTIVFICMGLMRFARNADDYHYSSSLYAIACCLLALTVQFVLYRTFALMSENKAIKLIRAEERKQYEISKSTVDLINIKYHDLKRRLASVNGITPEEAESLRETLQLWNTRFKTGNEVLDVILSENSLRYNAEGVEFTFIGDGGGLSFMGVTDIYSLFGNALENAADAARKLEEREKKLVSVAIEGKGDMISVTVTNYFDGEIKLENGLPVTTKQHEAGYHGFGLKSIKLVTEKYHGDLKLSVEGDLFCLSAYLMRA